MTMNPTAAGSTGSTGVAFRLLDRGRREPGWPAAHVVRTGGNPRLRTYRNAAIVLDLNLAEGRTGPYAATLAPGTLESILVDQILTDLGVHPAIGSVA